MLSEKRIFEFSNEKKNISLTHICGIVEQIWAQFTGYFFFINTEAEGEQCGLLL